MLTIRLSLYCIVIGLLVLMMPRQAFAEVLFEDDFNRDELGDWTVVRNFQWENASLPCFFEGAPAPWQMLLDRLGIKIDGPGCFTEIVPTGFQLPTNTGYAFEFDMTMPTSTAMDRNYTLRFVDPDHAYGVKILANQIFIGKAVVGSGQIPNSYAVYPFEANKTYHIRNELWADKTIRIYINGQLVIDTVDSEPSVDGGTIGFQASVGEIRASETWFDNVVVTSLPDPRDQRLDVPYFSQRDPSWKDLEYDSASRWAKAPDANTVERWGCALSSAAMILNYYGISEIEPGVQVNPLHLNDWLNAQPDGYVGDGLVNWIALTRLAYQFHQRHPLTASLEYTYDRLTMDEMTQQFQNAKPVILELPKHFVVATGIRHNDNSVFIHDPFYDRQTIDLTNSQPISSRIFSQSFTDLSYIFVTHKPGVTVQLHGDYEEFESHTESFQDDLEGEQTTSVVVHQKAKPKTGTYTLSVSPAPISQDIDVYFYQKDGTVQKESISVQTSAEYQNYLLSYNSEGESSIQKSEHHTAFLVLLNQSYQHHQIHSAFVYYTLLHLAQDQEQYLNDRAATLRYTNFISATIEKYSDTMSEGTKYTLLESLNMEAG